MCSGVLYIPSKVEQEQKILDFSICGGPSISFFLVNGLIFCWVTREVKNKNKNYYILYMVIREALCQNINIENRSIYFSIRI